MRTTGAQAWRAGGLGLGLGLASLAGFALAGPTANPTAPRQHVATRDATAPVTVTAMVDPSGTIVPAVPLPAAVEVLGLDKPVVPEAPQVAPQAGPCPKAPALSQDEARAIVLKVAQEEGFYPDFVLSVALVESNFRTDALSDKGAVGLMQLMPATGKTYKVDICDPRQNVLGGVRLLRSLHEKYKNPFFILAAYNAGEVAVQQAKGVPPIAETVRFVANVMNNFYEWPQIEKARPGSKRVASRADRTPGAKAPESNGRWSSGFVMHLDGGGVVQEENR